MDRLLYGVNASDPSTLAAIAILFAAVSVMASAVPAYRGARADRLTTLREEQALSALSLNHSLLSETIGSIAAARRAGA